MALLRNLDELKVHVPFTLGMKMDNMASFITQAEDQFLLPAIGQEAYADIHARYLNNNLSDPDQQKLLSLCQRSIAYYATLLFIPVGQLHISDAGIRIAVDEHFKQAFDWQINNLEESCRNAADLNLELTLSLLESKPTVFTAYHGSAAVQRNKECFVHIAGLLNQLCGVRLPRRHFQQVLPIIRQLQVLHLEPVLCSALYAQLQQQWVSGSVSAANKTLLNYIQPALAMLAMARSVSSLTLDFSSLGVTHTPADVSRLNIRQAASDAARAHFIEDKTLEGRSYLALLERHLQENVQQYPLFASSPCYQQPFIPEYNTDSPSGIYIV